MWMLIHVDLFQDVSNISSFELQPRLSREGIPFQTNSEVDFQTFGFQGKGWVTKSFSTLMWETLCRSGASS
jgi:hypothetical protein